MPSNFTKQPQYLERHYFNDGTGDSTLGGQITTAPSGTTASQGQQTLPGDRLVFGAADALALSDVANVGTLYCGIYMYVRLTPLAAASAKIGTLAFWDPAQFSVAASTYPGPDNLYQVTNAELSSSAGLTPPIAGVFINPVAAGNYWWIQIAGKATMAFGPFAGSQYGTATSYIINGAVFAGGYGTTGNGLVTQINGDTFPTTDAALAAMISGYLGVAEVAPTAGTLSTPTLSIVDMVPLLYRF